MSDQQEVGDSGAMKLLRKFVGLLVVVGLAAAVVYLLSERNARTFAVEQQGDKLVVMRGRMFPFGVEPFAPPDKVLAEAYAPITLAGDSPGDVVLDRYEDRDHLDRALFRVLRGWVEVRLDSDDPKRLGQAMSFLERAGKLTGIDEEERRQMRELQGRVAYFEGRARLEESLAALREAVAKLRLSSEGHSKYSRDAGELYERVLPLTEQLGHAVRQQPTSERREAEKPQEALPAAEKPAEKPETAPAAPTK